MTLFPIWNIIMMIQSQLFSFDYTHTHKSMNTHQQVIPQQSNQNTASFKEKLAIFLVEINWDAA